MKVVQFARPPPLLSIYVQNYSKLSPPPPIPQFEAKALLSVFSWLYTLVCIVVRKYHEMSFLYIITHIFSTRFAINPFCLHNLKT